MTNASPEQQKRIIDAVARAVPEYPMDAVPPLMAISLQRALREALESEDPYLELKRRSNQQVAKVLPRIESRLSNAEDPLREAAELAVAANIIDFGAQVGLDLEGEIERIVLRERMEEQDADGPFRFEEFQGTLETYAEGRLLMIGDNAGEMFFDRLLIQEIRKEYPEIGITYTVRGGPIINDGTYEDAEAAGIPELVPVIDTGLQAPGAILEMCSTEFREAFDSADMIVSKGQGNYEALSSCGRRVFFLFMVKCDVVADHTGLPKGTIVLAEGDGRDRLKLSS